jgi:hypothetical protein
MDRERDVVDLGNRRCDKPPNWTNTQFEEGKRSHGQTQPHYLEAVPVSNMQGYRGSNEVKRG